MSRMTNARRRTVDNAVTGTVLAVAVVVGLVPLVWMVVSSFKTDADIFSSEPLALPDEWTFDHYRRLFSQFHFGLATLNSVAIAGATVVISVVLGGLAAYGFSRYPFRGSGLAMAFLMLARMITPAALVVPLYIVMEPLRNTVASVIAGVAVLNLPFVIWLLKPFFDTVPRDVEEAALVDGLGRGSTFFRITLPLALPGVMTVILYSFLAGWTDLLFPMTFITSEAAMPLTSGLLQMQTGYRIYWGELMAGGFYLTLPALVIALAMQKYLLRGLRMGFT